MFIIISFSLLNNLLSVLIEDVAIVMWVSGDVAISSFHHYLRAAVDQDAISLALIVWVLFEDLGVLGVLADLWMLKVARLLFEYLILLILVVLTRVNYINVVSSFIGGIWPCACVLLLGCHHAVMHGAVGVILLNVHCVLHVRRVVVAVLASLVQIVILMMNNVWGWQTGLLDIKSSRVGVVDVGQV